MHPGDRAPSGSPSRRRCAASVPRVSEAKIGAQPGGSMITRKVTKAELNSSIIGPATLSSSDLLDSRGRSTARRGSGARRPSSTFQSQPSVPSADSPRPLSSGVVRACVDRSAAAAGSPARRAPWPRHEARRLAACCGFARRRAFERVAGVIDPAPAALLALPDGGEIAVRACRRRGTPGPVLTAVRPSHET